MNLFIHFIIHPDCISHLNSHAFSCNTAFSSEAPSNPQERWTLVSFLALAYVMNSCNELRRSDSFRSAHSMSVSVWNKDRQSIVKRVIFHVLTVCCWHWKMHLFREGGLCNLEDGVWPIQKSQVGNGLYVFIQGEKKKEVLKPWETRHVFRITFVLSTVFAWQILKVPFFYGVVCWYIQTGH